MVTMSLLPAVQWISFFIVFFFALAFNTSPGNIEIVSWLLVVQRNHEVLSNATQALFIKVKVIAKVVMLLFSSLQSIT